MKLVMEVWKRFLKEQVDMGDIDSMLDDGDAILSGKVSPKIKQLQQRLMKLGMSKGDASNFTDFQGMMGKKGENKEATLERKVAALEKFANTPLNKLPQQMKVNAGQDIQLSLNQNSWEGKVGDPKAPEWVKTIIPGWQTKNPIYPGAPSALGMAGKEILFRKLRAAASQTKKTPVAKQNKAPVQQKQVTSTAISDQNKKKEIVGAIEKLLPKMSKENQKKYTTFARPKIRAGDIKGFQKMLAYAKKMVQDSQKEQTPVVQKPEKVVAPSAPNDIVKKVQSGKWTKGGKSFPKANPEVINLIYKLQGLVGAKQDGVFGKKTAKAIQRKYYGK